MNNLILDNADAIVIGGGTIGSATAWHLAKSGLKKVVLIERNTIGSGNTSKAASLMTLVRTKEELIPLIQETYKNIEEVEALTGESTGKNNVGTLHIASSNESVANLDKITSIANKHHIKNKDITANEVQNKVPWMDTSSIIKASFMEDDSFVDAYLLANTFAKAAKIKGATIMQNTEVLELLSEDNEIKGVKTTKGTIMSPVVIDAAGLWSNLLSLQLNIPIPMAPVRSIYWITETIESLFPKNHPMLVMPDAMAYSRPENGALLFGLREENSPHFHPNELNPEPNSDFLGPKEDAWDIIENYGKDFIKYFPKFEDIGIKNCITGISTYTPDGYYTIGSFPNFKGFFAATGCAGAGVAGSGGIGRLVTEMVLNKPLYASSEVFKIDRFTDFDPLSATFRQRCADARSKKKDGG
ncbi:FAD-dependent oxidoreductase [Yeosuana marina]|uniref:NAD(P)/FAD-dependent oxidoreductase n=1 Tax=Yeosuana marina TaxID=1565536 RepID=UPI0030EF0FFD|tara:strand:+ start:4840 stop:6081 length:1242 start_codon:yes stop_codon:yes gene_type:complete